MTEFKRDFIGWADKKINGVKIGHCAARKVTKSLRAPLVSSQSDVPPERVVG